MLYSIYNRSTIWLRGRVLPHRLSHLHFNQLVFQNFGPFFILSCFHLSSQKLCISSTRPPSFHSNQQASPLENKPNIISRVSIALPFFLDRTGANPILSTPTEISRSDVWRLALWIFKLQVSVQALAMFISWAPGNRIVYVDWFGVFLHSWVLHSATWLRIEKFTVASISKNCFKTVIKQHMWLYRSDVEIKDLVKLQCFVHDNWELRKFQVGTFHFPHHSVYAISTVQGSTKPLGKWQTSPNLHSMYRTFKIPKQD